MQTDRFAGIIPPMLTPLTPGEEVDGPAVHRLVDFLIRRGVNGLFILGSMGEGPYLRPSVRKDLAMATVAAAASRVPVLAGVLEPGTTRVLEEMRRLSDTGISAYVVTTPFYYGGFNQLELQDHFRRVADATDRPILAYNIPQNTHNTMKSDLVLQLPALARVIGVKDSSGDWLDFQRVVRERPSDFVVFQGNQVYAGLSLLAGADGLVPGHANICPDLLVGMYSGAQRNDARGVWAAQAQLNELLRLRGRAPIHMYKVIANALGLMEDTVASSLPKLGPAEVRDCLNAHAKAGIFPES